MNIVCKDIKRYFAGVVALNSATLSVEKGEIRALLGGNGSGKSTLAKIIAGILSANGGEITVFDKKHEFISPAEAHKNGIVMTSQELSLLSNLSVEENLSLYNIPTNRAKIFINRKQISSAADQVLGRLGLKHLKERRILDLAPNEQYMIEFAKAIIQQPKILIIDEVTSALFKEDVAVVKKILHELKKEGCSIIFISHRMDEVFDMCDSVTVMRNGNTVANFNLSDVDENTLLESITGRIKTTDEQINAGSNNVESNRDVLLSIKGLKLDGYKHSINIDVRKNDVIGIAGLQGQGQSEFLRRIFGIAHENTRISIDGKELVINSPRQAIKNGIAFISGDREQEGVFREQSVAENLSVVSRMIFKNRKRNEGKLLKQYNVVYNSLKQKLTSLSGGNQQKVIIGRWTSTDPKILLADDPTKGVDVQARSDVHKIMCQMVDRGSTVLMVSSDNTELVNLTKRAKHSKVIIFYEGEIIRTLQGDEITEDNINEGTLAVKGERQ